MTRVDPRAPCLIGAGQWTGRGGVVAREPLALWEGVARDAAEGRVLGAVERLDVVYCQSWAYDDPARRLAERLGIEPRQARYSGIGGTMPLALVADAATAMLQGQLDVALIVGGEALATRRALRKAEQSPGWSHPEAERSPFPFEAPFHPAEVAHEVFQAWLTFALWDIARRAHLGVAPDEYRLALGRLFSPFTEIAAANPRAWFPTARTAEALVEPTPENRMVGYPYTKHLVAVMDVDMAAAVVLATHERADALGIPQDQRVYLRGWCSASDPVYVAEHEPTWMSPAMAAAGLGALDAASIGIDDVAHLDLYSCFPSSVLFACDALGIDPAIDPRSLTVTGGLPYHGGPGSCYGLHALATMAEVLRSDPGSYGLVSGVGMHMTKHSFGVWSTEPGRPAPGDVGPEAQATKDVRDTATGPATVAMYTVVHDRAGEPAWGLAVCDLPEGDRCYARVEDPALLRHIEGIEWVGNRVDLTTSAKGVNLVSAWGA